MTCVTFTVRSMQANQFLTPDICLQVMSTEEYELVARQWDSNRASVSKAEESDIVEKKRK